MIMIYFPVSFSKENWQICDEVTEVGVGTFNEIHRL